MPQIVLHIVLTEFVKVELGVTVKSLKMAELIC